MQTVYPIARNKFLTGDIAWGAGGDSFYAIACDSSYTYSPAHAVVDDVIASMLGSQALTGVAATGGVASAADVTITGLTPGASVRSFIIARDTGDTATDDLIWFANTHSDLIPINRVVDGSGSVTFAFMSGPDRIFQLGS